MRAVVIVLCGVVCAGGIGCGQGNAAGAGEPDVLVRTHLAGLARVAGDPDATKLKEVLALPETKSLRTQTVSRLALSPRVLFGTAVSAPEAEQGATLLRPLLDDVLDQESVLEVRGPLDKPEWMLAVALSPERKAAWQQNLAALMKLWKFDAPSAVTNAGVRTFEVKRPTSPGLIRWTEAGGWLVLGVGTGALPTSEAALQRIKTGGRPVAALTDSIGEAELALEQLRGVLNLPAAWFCPRVQVSLSGKGENLRCQMRLGFAEGVTGPIPAWHVPTNLIQEPLISFTAARGIAPWLQRSETLSRLGVQPPPNEIYFWAEQALVFQSYLAFPSTDPVATVERIGQRGSGILSEDWKKRRFATIEWQPSSRSSIWKDLPYITPFARPTTNGFVFAGLFPLGFGTNTVPRELLSQMTGRNDLIYYDWEITQGRLAQWRTTSQLFAMLADRSQFTSNMTAFRWLVAVEPHLGNTITEITAASPKEWSLARKSHLGLTGVELVALARWLESTNFPRLGLEMPRASAPAAATRPPRAAAPRPAPPATSKP